MMVNIIMPAYNAHDTIRQAVASVAMQDHLHEILLTIVDDCSDTPYDYIVDEFHYMNIEILRKPTNTGCGQSRQYGIDRCKCKYFMFLDTDDCLYSPFAVKQSYSFMEKNSLDILYTDFLQELPDGQYFLHKNSGVWMHGKMLRTKYIQEHNIRYSETRLHEDHAFNTISVLCGGKNMYIDRITYVWKHNEKSLTRSVEYTNDMNHSLRNFIINAEYTIAELTKRNVRKEAICEVFKKYILSFYKYYNIMIEDEMPSKSIKEYIKDINEFISETPCELTASITEEYLTENFYQDASIKEMVENDIMFVIPFDKYYEKINLPK